MMSTEDSPVSDAVKRLGLDHRLVKSWRMPGLNEYNTHGLGPVGIYIDPPTGLFYTRLPETEDGTLYADTTRLGLLEQLWPAVKALAEQEEPDTRTWDRRIRICYTRSSPVVGDLKAERTHPRGGGPHYTRTPWLDPVCPLGIEMGALVFSRYERAPDPEGRLWDVREWQEDYEARVAAWVAAEPGATRRLTQEGYRKSRPRRFTGRLWRKSHNPAFRPPEFRDLPWSADTWQGLERLTTMFHELDAMVRDFVLTSDDAVFLDKLGSGLALPMVDR